MLGIFRLANAGTLACGRCGAIFRWQPVLHYCGLAVALACLQRGLFSSFFLHARRIVADAFRPRCCSFVAAATAGTAVQVAGLAPELPEDLYHLIKKAVNIRRHLEKNRKDTDSKFRLILVESRIHRLARYYKVRARAHAQRQESRRKRELDRGWMLTPLAGRVCLLCSLAR